MKELRKRFERFCYHHRDQGIKNLMLYLSIASAVIYCINRIDPSGVLYDTLCFDTDAILHGQVWRLFTYVIVVPPANILATALSLFFYYYAGQMIESVWGTFRFNLYYLTGVVLMDIAALLLQSYALVHFLNLSLLLAFATLFPEHRVLVMYIIPVKLKYLAWVYFAIVIYEVIVYSFPMNLFPLLAILNYFLFFGADFFQVLPDFLQPRHRRSRSSYSPFDPKQRVVHLKWEKDMKQQSTPYHHKCTVCGRTDVSNPELEFRYCSKCNGYYCYCSDHINNHVHIQ